MSGRSAVERARSVEYQGVDAILMSGLTAGESVKSADLADVKKATNGIPVLANTGVNHDNVHEILSSCDGLIVGTSLKVGGDTWAGVDGERARRMVELVVEARRGGSALGT